MILKKQWKKPLCIISLLIVCITCTVYPVWADTAPLLSGFPSDQVHPEFAQGFTVEYHDQYKLVTVKNPWRGSNVTFTYVLVQKGGKPPILTGSEQVIEIPSERFVALSTTYLSNLEILGLLDHLVGVQSIGYVNTESVLDRYANGKVKDVAGTGSGMGAGVNMEILTDINPDLVMTSATGNPEYDNHLKLQESHIPVVLEGSYMEETPLGRAEWIKFISVFFNKEKEANEYFETVKKNYQEARSLVAASEKRPTVLVNYNYRGTWYAPGGASYLAQFLKDAGADYLWSTDTTSGSIPLDFETAYNAGLSAEYWLNPGEVTSLSQLASQDPRYQDIAAFKTGNVFNYNARTNANGGNDYWESGITHPDVILKDLIKIFHPDLLDHQFVYYQKLE